MLEKLLLYDNQQPRPLNIASDSSMGKVHRLSYMEY